MSEALKRHKDRERREEMKKIFEKVHLLWRTTQRRKKELLGLGDIGEELDNVCYGIYKDAGPKLDAWIKDKYPASYEHYEERLEAEPL